MIWKKGSEHFSFHLGDPTDYDDEDGTDSNDS